MALHVSLRKLTHFCSTPQVTSCRQLCLPSWATSRARPCVGVAARGAVRQPHRRAPVARSWCCAPARTRPWCRTATARSSTSCPLPTPLWCCRYGVKCIPCACIHTLHSESYCHYLVCVFHIYVFYYTCIKDIHCEYFFEGVLSGLLCCLESVYGCGIGGNLRFLTWRDKLNWYARQAWLWMCAFWCARSVELLVRLLCPCQPYEPDRRIFNKLKGSAY